VRGVAFSDFHLYSGQLRDATGSITIELRTDGSNAHMATRRPSYQEPSQRSLSPTPSTLSHARLTAHAQPQPVSDTVDHDPEDTDIEPLDEESLASGGRLSRQLSQPEEDDGRQSQPLATVVTMQEGGGHQSQPELATTEAMQESGGHHQQPESTTEAMEEGDGANQQWKEWVDWKLKAPFLVFQLCLTIGLFVSIVTLLKVSQSNSGFARLGGPPGIFSDHPNLEQAIWAQGLQYTSLPTFIMTLYRTIWEGIVAALAKRQPFVELRKEPWGGPSSKTVLLDYEAEPVWKAPYIALKNRHYFIAACMVSSLVMTLAAVPLTAFLFTPAPSAIDYPITVAFTSKFNQTALLEPFPDGPDILAALDSAAATLLLSAPAMHWTNGTNAYTPFVFPGLNANATNYAALAISANTTAYLSSANCRVLHEGDDFEYFVVQPLPGYPIINAMIAGTDRGCDFNTALVFDIDPNEITMRPLSIRSLGTLMCGASYGWTRFNLAAGKYSGDSKDNHSISNITVISCEPSYWAVPGLLNATLASSSVPSQLGSFLPNWPAAQEFSGLDPHILFEIPILEPGCTARFVLIQETSEFSRHVFNLAYQRSPNEPLRPDALLSALTDLFETTYAVLAASAMFEPLPEPRNATATAQSMETRLIVVPPVAYMIVMPLLAIAGLSIGAMFSARQKSALFEKPVGLLCIAGIGQRSQDLKDEVTLLLGERKFAGNFRETAMESPRFKSRWWYYDKVEQTIYNRIRD
jgi:hypothetical protein